MELNEMEKKLLFQVESDYQAKVLSELFMTVRYSNNSEQREAAPALPLVLCGGVAFRPSAGNGALPPAEEQTVQ